MRNLLRNRKGSGKIIALVLIIIVVFALVSLAIYYYYAYNNLTFNLNQVRLGEVSSNSLTLNVQIAINNTYLLPVYIPSGSFTLYLNDQRLGTGTFNSITVGGNNQGIVTVPVTINAADVPSAAFGVPTGGGTVTLTVQGSANLVVFSVPFNATLYNAQLT
ncbi:MAG: LEA type 2 family protein [Methanocella sp.]